MTARYGLTATGRSGFVSRCARWLIGTVVATGCLNPWPDEYPQRAPVTVGSGEEPNGFPGLADDRDPNGPSLFPDDGLSVDNGPESSGAGGGSSGTPASEAEPDAGAPPPSDAGLTVTTTRLRGLRDAGTDAE
jgi:hypothetical protein